MDHWVLFCHAYHQTGHNNLYKQIIHVAMQKRRNIGEKGNIGIAFLLFPFRDRLCGNAQELSEFCLRYMIVKSDSMYFESNDRW